jgi:hypothetical protein
MQWLRNLLTRKPHPADTLTSALREGSEAGRRLQEARDRERFLTERLSEMARTEAAREAEAAFQSMAADLIEARAMAGAGPWRVGPEALAATEALIDRVRQGPTSIREDALPLSAGAAGETDLIFQTLDWRREINFSAMQFTRWGIQQIILVCRLYWLKNPIARRLVDVCAAYVFARSVEVTTSDPAANETIKEFFRDNRSTFGQIALTQIERSKDTDGNVFWCFFPDSQNSGRVKCRTIDATEISEIVSNPDDADEPWYYLRIWTQGTFDAITGQTANQTRHAWYPAMGFEPAERPDSIRNWPVLWNTATHHRRCGTVGKWQYGCPRIYPMITWAKEAKRYLEACASVAQQLAQFALTLTTKGGQQALMGAKQQMGTTVGPNTQVWDANPTMPGGIFASGTGTKMEAFKTQGAGCDPEKVRQYKLMCAMVQGVPETFLGDVSTGNLATATSLDRPTEIVFLERQESWVEDLQIMMTYVLRMSARAPKGRLSEAHGMGVPINIVECAKKRRASGQILYEAFSGKPNTIEVQVNFPDIREGDRAANVAAIVDGMTLANKAGLIIGIDEKRGVQALYNALDIEGGEELAEEQYPKETYNPDRTKEVQPAPIEKPKPQGGIQPAPDQVPDNRGDQTQ